MLKSNYLVLKDHVHTIGSDPIVTPSDFNTKLSLHEQLVIHAIVDDVTGGGGAGFRVQLYHSADGRNWKAKVKTAEIGGANGETLVAGQHHQFYGYDSGTSPSLAYVQLRIVMPPGTAAQVSIYVTVRDWN